LVTPNGDGKNDCLVIRDENLYDIIPGSQFDLFNRWGDQVYKNTFYKNGDFCGNNLPDGVYYYYLKTSCENKEIKGWLQIISNTENWNQ
jgi:gliding motility-associated-like protein